MSHLISGETLRIIFLLSFNFKTVIRQKLKIENKRKDSHKLLHFLSVIPVFIQVISVSCCYGLFSFPVELREN